MQVLPKMALRIEDYAIIGDCETAALVGKNGSIDWLCLPDFDSAASFCALLGGKENGSWRLFPKDPDVEVHRRYRPGTLILETVFKTDSAEAVVIDFMPIRESQKPELIRIIEGRRGTLEFEMEFIVRFDYGSIVPWIEKTDEGLWAIGGPDSVYLKSPKELKASKEGFQASFTVSSEENLSFHLCWCPSNERVPKPDNPQLNLNQTQNWWTDWLSQCTYEGEWSDAVHRSLITLKALTYPLTGAIVAAPTTSLPEVIGGERNWDYRFCWLRDATFVLLTFIRNGFHQEAQQWYQWLSRAIAGKPENIQIMYGLRGERRHHENSLDWLHGYEGSLPVREGNLACKQTQWDVYGEVMDVLYIAEKSILNAHRSSWKIQKGLLEYLKKHWREPDEGIWEVRGPKRQFTHSKVMIWVAFDRAIRFAEERELDEPIEQWKELREEISNYICKYHYDSEKNTFLHFQGAQSPDASLLLLPIVGFLPATDKRIHGTVKAIENCLLNNKLIRRYATSEEVTGLKGTEGEFLLCTFWYVDYLYLSGQKEKAKAHFESLLSLRNDLGLLSEEYDANKNRMLGNFPQAFSHVGLINTACILSEQKSLPINRSL